MVLQKGEAFFLLESQIIPQSTCKIGSETNPVTEGYPLGTGYYYLPRLTLCMGVMDRSYALGATCLLSLVFSPPIFSKKNYLKRDSKVAMSRLKLMNLPDLCLIIASESLTYMVNSKRCTSNAKLLEDTMLSDFLVFPLSC